MDDAIPEHTKPLDKDKAVFVAYLVARGSPLKTACEKAKVNRTTVYNWKTNHPDFWAAAKAEVEQCADIQWLNLQARRVINQVLSGEDEDISAHARMQLAQWVADRTDGELAAKDAGPRVDARSITINNLQDLSDDQLDALAANPEMALDE